jgi:hypothetical protein
MHGKENCALKLHDERPFRPPKQHCTQTEEAPAQLGLHGPSRFGFGLLSEQELEALANAPRRRRMEKREEARARCLASREAATEAARQRLGSAKAAADKAALSARLARRAWIEALLVDDEHEGPP